MKNKFILGMLATTLSFNIAGAQPSAPVKQVTALDLIDEDLKSVYQSNGFTKQAFDSLVSVAVDALVITQLNKMAGGDIRSRTKILSDLNRSLEQLRNATTDEDLEKQIKQIRGEPAYQVVDRKVEKVRQMVLPEGATKDAEKIAAEVDQVTITSKLTEGAEQKIKDLEFRKIAAPSEVEREARKLQLQKQIRNVSGALTTSLRNSGLLIRKVVVRGGQILFAIDIINVGYVTVALNRDPNILPVVSAFVDKTGISTAAAASRDYIDEKAKELNSILVEMTRNN